MKKEGFLSSNVLIILLFSFLILVFFIYKASQIYSFKRTVNRFHEEKEMTPFVESIKQKLQIIDYSSSQDNIAATCFKSGRQNYNFQLNQMCRNQEREENCSLWLLNLGNVKDLNNELDKTISNCTKVAITPSASTQ